MPLPPACRHRRSACPNRAEDLHTTWIRFPEADRVIAAKSGRTARRPSIAEQFVQIGFARQALCQSGPAVAAERRGAWRSSRLVRWHAVKLGSKAVSLQNIAALETADRASRTHETQPPEGVLRRWAAPRRPGTRVARRDIGVEPIPRAAMIVTRRLLTTWIEVITLSKLKLPSSEAQARFRRPVP